MKTNQPERFPVRDWKARRNGLIYCAPACGGNCTWDAYCDAVKASKELAENLGQGWRTRVQENLGWYWNVISPCGRIKVSPQSHPENGIPSYYTAFLGDADEDGCCGRYAEFGDTPRDAIKNVLRKAKGDLKRLNAALAPAPWMKLI